MNTTSTFAATNLFVGDRASHLAREPAPTWQYRDDRGLVTRTPAADHDPVADRRQLTAV